MSIMACLREDFRTSKHENCFQSFIPRKELEYCPLCSKMGSAKMSLQPLPPKNTIPNIWNQFLNLSEIKMNQKSRKQNLYVL